LQSLHERCELGLRFWFVLCTGQDEPDTPHALALLRARSNRPCRRASYQRDEIASPHVRPKSKATAS
jgi:hypothetical protein